MPTFGQPILNGFCCCAVGSPVVRYQNITAVRPKGDTLPATYVPCDDASYPYPRFDSGTYNADNPGTGCGTLAAGSCGAWIVGGDLNGLDAQDINSGTNDIGSLGSPDVIFDHNSYKQVSATAAGAFVVGKSYKIVMHGTTDFTTIGAADNNVGAVFTAMGVGSGTGTAIQVADMRAAKLKGYMEVLARKFKHGALGFNSPDRCATSQPTLALDYPTPDTNKYRTITYNNITYLHEFTASEDNTVYPVSYGVLSGAVTVNATTGLLTCSLNATGYEKSWTMPPMGASLMHLLNDTEITGLGAGTTQNYGEDPVAVASGLQTAVDGYAGSGSFFCGDTPRLPYETNSLADWVTGWNALGDVGTWASFETLPAITDPDNYSATATAVYGSSPGPGNSDGSVPWVISISWSRTDTSFAFSYDYVRPVELATNHISFNGSVEFSDPYSDAEFVGHLESALNAWDMSNLNLAKFRLDEILTLQPCCFYNEVPSVVSPLITYVPTMNDYSATQNGDGTWPPTPWIDSNDFIWQYPDGSGGWLLTPLYGFSGGARMIGGGAVVAGYPTHLRTDDIISHTVPGADRHFWFGAQNLVRRVCDGDSGNQWELYSHGAFCDPNLPPVTMRWLDTFTANYDGSLCGTSPSEGNYPQAFFRYGLNLPGCGVVSKFVMASIRYPAVNYGRPCGADKFSVDQTSVCRVTDSTSFNNTTGGTLTVSPTSAATAPSSGYALVEGKGIYPITGLSGTTMTTGARIDTLPTGVNCFPPELWGTDTYRGDGGVYVGKLRWIGYTNYGVTWTSAPGICGRVAVTTAYASGTLTVASSAALPYFRAASDSALRPVNLYDSTWTKLNSTPLTPTRVDDSHFTFAGENYPTAVWMIDAQFDSAVGYAKYTRDSQKTAVRANWTFSRRAMALTTPPTWFAGLPGVTAGTLTQFTYGGGSCPSAVGFVPFADGAPAVENFRAQTLFDLPAIATDEAFGSHSQAAVMFSMDDPFFQKPFTPYLSAGAFIWSPDQGQGEGDSSGPPAQYFYPMPPPVEAATGVPGGYSLPTGLFLPLDPGYNAVHPPYWPTGIPNSSGGYGQAQSEWANVLRICDNIASSGRFSALYATYGIQC